MRDRPLGFPVGSVDIDDARRIGPAPGAIVAGISPELAGLGAPAPGVEHRRRRLVGEQLGGRLERDQHAIIDRSQQPGGAADPIRQGGAIEIDALAGVDLGLPVQRQMIGVFGDENLRDGRIGRQSALDQPRRCGSLHHDLFAGPAAVFGTAHDKHAQLSGDDVQPFAHVLADPMQRMMAARTGVILDVDHHLDARQMHRKGAAVLAAPGGAFGVAGRIGPVRFGLAARERLLDLLQAEQKLSLGV
jgi:hypothetical protein